MYKLNKLTLIQREELSTQLRISITHHSNGETKELLELNSSFIKYSCYYI